MWHLTDICMCSAITAILKPADTNNEPHKMSVEAIRGGGCIIKLPQCW